MKKKRRNQPLSRPPMPPQFPVNLNNIPKKDTNEYVPFPPPALVRSNSKAPNSINGKFNINKSTQNIYSRQMNFNNSIRVDSKNRPLPYVSSEKINSSLSSKIYLGVPGEKNLQKISFEKSNQQKCLKEKSCTIGDAKLCQIKPILLPPPILPTLPNLSQSSKPSPPTQSVVNEHLEGCSLPGSNEETFDPPQTTISIVNDSKEMDIDNDGDSVSTKGDIELVKVKNIEVDNIDINQECINNTNSMLSDLDGPEKTRLNCDHINDGSDFEEHNFESKNIHSNENSIDDVVDLEAAKDEESDVEIINNCESINYGSNRRELIEHVVNKQDGLGIIVERFKYICNIDSDVVIVEGKELIKARKIIPKESKAILVETKTISKDDNDPNVKFFDKAKENSDVILIDDECIESESLAAKKRNIDAKSPIKFVMENEDRLYSGDDIPEENYKSSTRARVFDLRDKVEMNRRLKCNAIKVLYGSRNCGKGYSEERHYSSRNRSPVTRSRGLNSERKERSSFRSQSPPQVSEKFHRTPDRRHYSPEERDKSNGRQYNSSGYQHLSPRRQFNSPVRRYSSPGRRCRSPERRKRGLENRDRSPIMRDRNLVKKYRRDRSIELNRRDDRYGQNKQQEHFLTGYDKSNSHNRNIDDYPGENIGTIDRYHWIAHDVRKDKRGVRAGRGGLVRDKRIRSDQFTSNNFPSDVNYGNLQSFDSDFAADLATTSRLIKQKKTQVEVIDDQNKKKKNLRLNIRRNSHENLTHWKEGHESIHNQKQLLKKQQIQQQDLLQQTVQIQYQKQLQQRAVQNQMVVPLTRFAKSRNVLRKDSNSPILNSAIPYQDISLEASNPLPVSDMSSHMEEQYNSQIQETEDSEWTEETFSSTEPGFKLPTMDSTLSDMQQSVNKDGVVDFSLNNNTKITPEMLRIELLKLREQKVEERLKQLHIKSQQTEIMLEMLEKQN